MKKNGIEMLGGMEMTTITNTAAAIVDRIFPRKGSPLLAVAMLGVFGSGLAIAEPMLHTPTFYRSADMSRFADNYVELGVGYNSKDSYKFGEWTGLRDDGAYPIVGVNWLSRSSDDDARYWRLTGSNLGLETRKFGFEFGHQGSWVLSASADRLVRSELDSARFVHPNGLGTDNLSGIASRPITSATPTTPFKIEQGRDFYRLGLKTNLSKHWDMEVAYREDVRDGTRVMGVPFGGFGNPNNVPYAIDDHTQQLDWMLAFADERGQLQLAYHFSRFENELQSLTLENPIRPAGGATTVLPEIGRVSLMPGNEFHQVAVTGSYRLTNDTRLTSKLSYGLGTQDETFLPYTTGTAAVALPRTSLDGEVARTLFDVTLTTRPTADSSLKLGYQYYDHDNQTPRSSYLYARQDANQGAVAGTTFARTNAPLSTTEHKVIADGDVRFGSNNVLRANLEFSQKDYKLSDRAETETAKAGLEWRRPIFDTLSGVVGYERMQRTGSEYDRYAFIAASYDNPQLTLYHPSLRAYMYNDFDQDKLRANASWQVSDTVNVQGSIEGYQQRFEDGGCSTVNPTQDASFGVMPDQCLGRNLAEGGTANIDLQWQPEENITTFTFVNYSLVTTEQVGRSWGSVANAIDPLRKWSAVIDSQDHAVGVGFKWQPDVAARWDLGGHYVFSQGDVKTGFVTTLAGEAAVPNVSTTSHAVQLYAKWAFSHKMTIRFNYLYETLESNDWAVANPATGNPYGPIVGTFAWTGQSAPKYENHAVGVSVALHSW